MSKITILSLHLGYGGIETAVCTLANNLIKKHEVTILSVYKLYDDIPHELNKDIKIQYILDNKPNKKEIKACLKKFNLFKLVFELFYALKLLYRRKKSAKKILKNCDADFIISTRYLLNNWLKYIKKFNIIKIGWEHNHHNNNCKYIRKVINSCNNLNYLVNVSRELDFFYKDKLANKKCQSVYIPNIVDKANVFSKLNTKNLVTIGRLSMEKGFLDLIDIFNDVLKYNPECILNIVGDGDQKAIIESKIRGYGIEKSVNLYGYKDSKFINELLNEQSIYIMTSYTESFGIVLLEAMNKKIPCVAFDSAQGANEIIVNNYNGFLVKDRDKMEMVKKINFLINDAGERLRMGKNALATCSNYSSSKITKLWENLFVKKSTKDLKVLFISSTGGHLSELLQMEKIFNRYNFHIITEKTKSTIDLKIEYGKRIDYLLYCTKAKLFSYAYKFPYNCIRSLILYVKVRPKVIITTGAHTAVPMCYIGKIFGSKIIFIETLANIDSKTISGTLVYPISNLFIVQWENMLRLYPKAILGGKMY